HQRDDAFFAPIRRDRDLDQALLDAIAAIAAVAGHKERLPSLGGVLERAGEQLRRHLRRQAGKKHTRPLYYAHARALIRQCVGVSHEQLLAAVLRPASPAEEAVSWCSIVVHRGLDRIGRDRFIACGMIRASVALPREPCPGSKAAKARRRRLARWCW